jgi:formate hydrogenlyase subunit 6/NADH:ubiquinone oxidoreductase subunit I
MRSYIEGAEDARPYDERKILWITGTPRFIKIDYGRCILCGLLRRACPTDAIIHGHNLNGPCIHLAKW